MSAARRIVPGLLALAALLRAAPAAAQPASLSLREAVRRAAEGHPAVLAARARIAQAESRVRQARSVFLPTITGVATEGERTFNSASLGIRLPAAQGQPSLFPPEGAVFGPIRQYDLRARAAMILFDVSALERLRALRHTSDAATAEAANAAQAAGALAAAGYVRALRAERLVAARTADSALAAGLVGIARDQVAAGVGIAVDVTRAEAQLATVRAQLIASRNERDRALLELQRAVAVPAGTALRLTDTLAAPRAEDVVAESLAVARALAARPDLRAVAEQLEAQRRQVAALLGDYVPQVTASADHGVTGVVPTRALPTYTWGIAVTLPLFDGFRREGRGAEVRAQLRELEARERDLRDQAALDVRGAVLDLASAREQVDAVRTRLRLAELELAQTRDRFAAGVTGNAEVIQASIALNGARTAALDALAGYHAARVALARAQGAVLDLP